VKLPPRFSWSMAIVLMLLLLGGLVELYGRTREFDRSAYVAEFALLRNIRQVDAVWERDVLRTRLGFIAHYDTLAEAQHEMWNLMAKLEPPGADPLRADTLPAARARAALRAALVQKQELIEEFKSHNAIMQNSLVFLPAAADEVLQGIGRGQDAHQKYPGLTSDVNRVLVLGLLSRRTQANVVDAEVELASTKLISQRRHLNAPMRVALDNYLLHSETVMRERRVVQKVMAGIMALPTTARLDQLTGFLLDEQAKAAAADEKYWRYGLFVAGALSLLLLLAAAQLIRGRTQLARINAELKFLNESLEARVRERTAELQQAQGDLVKAARRAGMAEIATNVLHNVGNVLNSVNVSAGLLTARLRNSKVAGLAQATALMNDHAGNLGEFITKDPKGALLPGYLRELTAALKSEQDGMEKELRVLIRSVDHIKEVVATQQSYAGSGSLVEPTDVAELVEDAVRFNSESLNRHQVRVVIDLGHMPKVPFDRPRVTQILVNLICNAKQALAEVTGRIRCINLRAYMLDDGMLRFAVSDNGDGIARENLVRIFSHGFTTRKDGHDFGLHSCILAAKEMGGALTASSDGPGLGATFTLDIPVSKTMGAS